MSRLVWMLSERNKKMMTHGETVCECCWKVIEGHIFIVDDVAMCEDCYIYHVEEVEDDTQ